MNTHRQNAQHRIRNNPWDGMVVAEMSSENRRWQHRCHTHAGGDQRNRVRERYAFDEG